MYNRFQVNLTETTDHIYVFLKPNFKSLGAISLTWLVIKYWLGGSQVSFMLSSMKRFQKDIVFGNAETFLWNTDLIDLLLFIEYPGKYVLLMWVM